MGHLLCTRNCSCCNSFKVYTVPMEWVLLLPHFTDKVTEERKEIVACSVSHRQLEVETAFKSSLASELVNNANIFLPFTA